MLTEGLNSTASLLQDEHRQLEPGQGSTELMLKKLDAGGFSAVSCNSAEDLRDKADYLGITWTKKLGRLRGLERYNHICSVALNHAARAFEVAQTDAGKFGPQMREDLRWRIHERRLACGATLRLHRRSHRRSCLLSYSAVQGPMEHRPSMGGAIVDIVEAIANLDGAPELHTARLLVLLDAFAGEGAEGVMEGLTKLAKLDFLLRYPVMLERAIKAKARPTREVQMEDHERQSVESEMVRYRFGPWDHRYREFLNILIAKGLVVVSVEGRTVVVVLTDKGREVAKRFANEPLFEPYARRSKLLKRHFDMTATNLMRFIYETFPEIVTLRSNEAIPT